LQGLCCLDAQGAGAWALLEEFLRDSREPALIVDEALRLLRKAFDDRPVSDELLARHARRWDLPRLALVDRNILRLAVHELRKGSVPPKVILSEALRLAREFSTAESPRFVNGVLDAVAKELQNGSRDMPPEENTPEGEPPPPYKE